MFLNATIKSQQEPSVVVFFLHPTAIHFKEALIVKQARCKGLENVL